MKVNLRHAAFSINVSGGGVGGLGFFIFGENQGVAERRPPAVSVYFR